MHKRNCSFLRVVILFVISLGIIKKLGTRRPALTEEICNPTSPWIQISEDCNSDDTSPAPKKRRTARILAMFGVALLLLAVAVGAWHVTQAVPALPTDPGTAELLVSNSKIPAGVDMQYETPQPQNGPITYPLCFYIWFKLAKKQSIRWALTLIGNLQVSATPLNSYLPVPNRNVDYIGDAGQSVTVFEGTAVGPNQVHEIDAVPHICIRPPNPVIVSTFDERLVYLPGLGEGLNAPTTLSGRINGRTVSEAWYNPVHFDARIFATVDDADYRRDSVVPPSMSNGMLAWESDSFIRSPEVLETNIGRQGTAQTWTLIIGLILATSGALCIAAWQEF